MKSILKHISILRGVHHVCLYQQGKAPVSNFPDDIDQAMTLSYELIDQIFSALKAIEKSHNEIYFSLGDKFLVAYLMDETCIALLLTEKKINFPLLNMGIKSAKMKLQRLLKNEQKQKMVVTAPKNLASQSAITNTELEVVFNQLLNLLKQYLGPAAIFIFEDATDKWKKTYLQQPNNLPHLIDLIKQNLDPNREQQDFSKQAQAIITQF